jgi:hypothetical protein
MWLYRALREDEIQSQQLIPKTYTPFVLPPHLPLRLPFCLEPSFQHAVRAHILDGNIPTRGVSCTTDWSVAESYAQNSRVIATIDVEKCLSLGIHIYGVADHVPAELIIKPDKEFVLVSDTDLPFPREIIRTFTRV